MPTTEIKTVKAVELEEAEVGKTYLVEFKDCCVTGRFVGKLLHIHEKDLHEDPTYWNWEFDVGLIEGWAFTLKETGIENR